MFESLVVLCAQEVRRRQIECLIKREEKFVAVVKHSPSYMYQYLSICHSSRNNISGLPQGTGKVNCKDFLRSSCKHYQIKVRRAVPLGMITTDSDSG